MTLHRDAMLEERLEHAKDAERPIFRIVNRSDELGLSEAHERTG
jgi:hypothetical protein